MLEKQVDIYSTQVYHVFLCATFNICLAIKYILYVILGIDPPLLNRERWFFVKQIVTLTLNLFWYNLIRNNWQQILLLIPKRAHSNSGPLLILPTNSHLDSRNSLTTGLMFEPSAANREGDSALSDTAWMSNFDILMHQNCSHFEGGIFPIILLHWDETLPSASLSDSSPFDHPFSLIKMIFYLSDFWPFLHFNHTLT